jgi:hypothetical protein
MIKALKSFGYNLYLALCYTSGKATLYRHGEKKPAILILKELLIWWMNEREFNTMYYVMGLNLKGTDSRDFIGRHEFLKLKRKVESQMKKNHGSSGLDYDSVTKDKFVAGSFFKANYLDCAETVALINDGFVNWQQAKEEPLESLVVKDGKYIIKHIILEAGEGTYCLEVKDGIMLLDGKQAGIQQLKSLLQNGIWVMQALLKSHAAIRKINSSALNTTRIVTYIKNGEPTYLAGFQVFATNGENTDSWHKGSVCVSIDIEHECLKGEGYYNLSVAEKSTTAKHPDSGIVFDGYPLPHLKNAVGLCIKAHKLLYFNFIIGWDVAITDTGPIIIEANEKPGMNVVQCLDGGLKKLIRTAADTILQDKK